MCVCVCACMRVCVCEREREREKSSIMSSYYFGHFMYTFLLLLQSAVCSPLFVRYSAVQMTPIIIIKSCHCLMNPAGVPSFSPSQAEGAATADRAAAKPAHLQGLGSHRATLLSTCPLRLPDTDSGPQC